MEDFENIKKNLKLLNYNYFDYFSDNCINDLYYKKFFQLLDSNVNDSDKKVLLREINNAKEILGKVDLGEFKKIMAVDLQKLRNVDENNRKTFYKKDFKENIKNRDDLIKKWFTFLEDREKELIIHSYGLQGEKSKEDSVIAKILKTSQQMVKSKREKITRRLAKITTYNFTQIFSLRDEIKDENIEKKYDDYINEELNKELEKYLEKKGEKKVSRKFYSQCDEETKEIIDLRFGLNNKSSKSREEVAVWAWTSSLMVKIIECKALGMTTKTLSNKQKFASDEGVSKYYRDKYDLDPAKYEMIRIAKKNNWFIDDP